MKQIRIMASGAALTLCFVAGMAHAQTTRPGGMYVAPPNWEMLEKLTPEQRQQAITIQEKMMQMQMQHEDDMAKMEMKYKHDMMQMQSQMLDLYRGH
ncbi:MAG TPA: hypothetical protein VL598_02405 [Trinickia sp.]|jgi:hypothetical protein|uniref:hypothetical protein n=1 Tax=Trinickia sp. TaxID=2571163 RepID=UPI002D078F1F|nr:hypothetical protein [Trinickia sp.]HTI16498.1 hypothetical protein [Trinickia sp.]